MELPFVKNGKTLLSGIDPVRLAERAADAVNITGKTLYFCPSPILGYGLERFLSRLSEHSGDSDVLCVEADLEIYKISAEHLSPLLARYKNLHLINICEIASKGVSAFLDAGAELAAVIRAQCGEKAFRRVETLRLTGGWQLFPEIYESLCDTIRREIASEWSNALTLTKLGRLYIRNFFRNLSLANTFPSLAELSFGSSPVLVLGAGPSLDETLEQLTVSSEQRTQNNDKLAERNLLPSDIFHRPEARSFKIVCVDTCLGALKDRNIVPDLVVVLESQHWNMRDFSGCRGWNVPAAVDFSALPASSRILDGGGYVFFTPWTRLRIFERLKNAGLLPAVVPPLGSVGLTAVEIARRLTTGKIICSGLDFSFSADKYHARGTQGHRRLLNTQTRLKRIANIAAFAQGVFSAVSKSGSSVYTNPIMKNYRDLFEREFADDERLRDIEGTGLSLGIKTITIKEAMNELGIENSFSQRRIEPSVRDAEEEKERINSSLCPCEPQVRRLGVSNSNIPLVLNNDERSRLLELRNILAGDIAMDKNRLSILIDECDYLWAHFPDCAGGRHPGLEDISFLKRVRTEIDPMLKVMEWN